MILLFLVLVLGCVVGSDRINRLVTTPEDGMVLSGLRGKALYLYKQKQLLQFPDFYTFSAMGYNMSNIRRMKDEMLLQIPRGTILATIKGPPPFRPDDAMYHSHCDDPSRLINDLSVVANVGNFHRYLNVHQRVSKSKKIDILALGGSITAGGYFMEFVRHLQEQEGLAVKVHNHGHGATELTCTYTPHLNALAIQFIASFFSHQLMHSSSFLPSLALNRYHILCGRGSLPTRPNSHRLLRKRLRPPQAHGCAHSKSTVLPLQTSRSPR